MKGTLLLFLEVASEAYSRTAISNSSRFIQSLEQRQLLHVVRAPLIIFSWAIFPPFQVLQIYSNSELANVHMWLHSNYRLPANVKNIKKTY